MNNFEHLIDTEQIYQHAPSGYLSMLPDGTIIKINQTLLDWLGYQRENVIGKLNFSSLLSKGGAIHYEMFFRPMVSVNGNIKELNYELIGAGDKNFPALISANGVMDENRKLLAVNMVITDITQRNLYEKELLSAKNKLQSEKTRFELLADLSEELIWTVDYHGEVNYFNGRMSRYFNLSRGDAVTSILFQHIHPEDRRKLMQAWHGTDKTLDPYINRLRFGSEQKGYEWFEVHLIAVNDLAGDIRWFGTANSINHLMMTIERKDEFIHIASHELNTPVTVLKGFLQLMKYGLPAENMNNFISKCLATVNYFQFLIGSLLNVSVINSGELVLNISSFSLAELLLSCIEQASALSNSHTILLQSNVDKIFVTADKERITQVIINLLNNAIKYSPGKKEVLLMATLLPDQHQVAIAVKDYGVGIATDQLDKIFEKYYRIRETQSIKGLGLGLYITQNILMAHGTRLNVETKLGEGSTFSFIIP
ncbi:MAG: ATP-binding protein, partial [Bacteroidota bacterium]